MFPQTILPLTVELLIDGVWTELPVYRRDLVNISRGTSGEGSQVDRSTLSFTLNNRSGDFSPRNPNSQYYGLIGRNTPIRASIADSEVYLEMSGWVGAKVSAPDATPLGVTGDIDIRADVTLANWANYYGYDLAGKYLSTGNQRSWAFYLSAGVPGELAYSWSANGTAVSTVTSTEVLPAPRSGRMALRVTHDVNNGAAGNTVTFWYADNMASTWIQLGDPVVSGGTTSIFDSTAPLEVGDVASLANDAVMGRYHSFELRNGIGGTVVANPDFSIQTPGDTSFPDTASSPNTWTTAAGCDVTNRNYRFHGEVSAWPQRWDTTGTDVYVPIESAGVLQRLGNSGDALQSVMYRGLIFNSSGLVAYWPIEDVKGSTSVAPALDTHGPLSISGSPLFEEYEGFDSSFPIPVLNGAAFSGSAPAYTVGTETQVRWLMAVPSGGAENGQTILLVYTTGSVRRWEVVYTTASSGSLSLIGYDGSGAQLFTSGAATFAVNGEKLLCSVELTQIGANIGWNLLTLEPGATSGLTISGTLNSNTVGKVGVVTVSPGGGMAGIAIGHLSVQNDVTSLFELGPQLSGWSGETAGRRIERLCAEGGVAFRAIGNLDDSAPLGTQKPDTILTLIREAAATDMGIVYEPRETFGLGYRTRSSLYNQTPQLALDYTANNLANALDPVDDDRSTRNDVTVTRSSGSSARSVLESGPLSILSPPNGVGRYSGSDTTNVEHDLYLADQSRWRLRIGTVDESRYPQIPVNLAHPSIAGHATLPGETNDLEIGDRITVSNPPSWLPPEEISSLVMGYAEVMGNFEHAFTFNCVPESPYRVAVFGSGNLAVNGSFDANTTGWSAVPNSGISRITAAPTPFAGAGCLQITRTAANPPFHLHGAQCTDVARGALAGDLCTVSFYARIPSAVFAKVTDLVVGGTGIAATFIDLPTVADTWTLCTLPAVALSADADDIQVQFWTDGTLTNGTVVAQIDSFSIRMARHTDEVDRWQPESSVLGGSLTSSATSVSVSTPVGPLWTTDANEFPFDIAIGGEQIAVVGISGTSSPQTFTLARSRNGVVKAHASGSTVELVRKSVYGL